MFLRYLKRQKRKRKNTMKACSTTFSLGKYWVIFQMKQIIPPPNPLLSPETMHNSFNIWIWFKQMSPIYLFICHSPQVCRDNFPLATLFSLALPFHQCACCCVWVCLHTLQGQDYAGVSALSWMHLVQSSTCALTAECASLGGDERFCSGETEDSDSWDLPSVEFLNNGLFNWQPQKDFVNSTSRTYTVNKRTKLNLHL